MTSGMTDGLWALTEKEKQTLRLMGVQPDMEVKPLIVANPVEEPSL